MANKPPKGLNTLVSLAMIGTMFQESMQDTGPKVIKCKKCGKTRNESEKPKAKEKGYCYQCGWWLSDE